MNTRWFSVSVMALVASAGCNPTTPTPAITELPCDVNAVLAERCQSCHSNPPMYGAPMPLASWNDTQRSSVTDPTRKVWQVMNERINSATNPMPPTGMLPANELAVLNSWMAANTPKNASACGTNSDAGADADAAPTTGPAALPCPESDRVSYLAHAAGSADAKFAVPADAGNLYKCFSWRSNFTTPTQATAFAPVIDDTRVVHHFILYQTATEQPEGGVANCQMPPDAQFVNGWAPGGGNKVLPADVGQTLPGPDHWFILQVHYWNVAAYTDSVDRSGVTLCTTHELRTHAAAVHTLGSANILLPARMETTVTGTCTPANTEPVHVIGAGPHMHQTGVSFNTKILRGGDPSVMEMLVNVPHWDFQTQEAYDVDKIIMPGDKLQTECVYQNPTDHVITFGERTEDEMCFDFVLAWPAGALANTAGAASNRCIDRRN